MANTGSDPIEIERKFLVTGDGWRAGAEGEAIAQGYLTASPAPTVRVRVGDRGSFLTIKGKAKGITTPEFEYEIPRDHALAILALCTEGRIEKTRYRVDVESHVFEVDVFEGDNEGLVMAEVELEREDEPYPRPPWLGREVSHDPRFKNARLARDPFRPDWKVED
ncbi:MAG: CYTH domain-containing protein [Myxococcota bacterium]|jgi:CYTH domain-containing protein|nr:CYTH domain-containing protein [Myxococcota bacterium]